MHTTAAAAALVSIRRKWWPTLFLFVRTVECSGSPFASTHPLSSARAGHFFNWFNRAKCLALKNYIAISGADVRLRGRI